MGSLASAGTALYYAGCDDHFLLSCCLCNRPLGFNSDIFMYRGDMPFCSEDCRAEQIEMDEAEERRKWMKSSNSRRKNITPSPSSSSSSPPSSSSTSSSSTKSEPVAVA